MKKFVAMLLALVMALSLVACGQKEDNIDGEKKNDQTQTDGQTVDLRAAYEAGIKQVQEELGDNAPVLLEETAVEILNSYYPGLENAKLKQSVFFISPTATSCVPCWKRRGCCEYRSYEALDGRHRRRAAGGGPAPPARGGAAVRWGALAACLCAAALALALWQPWNADLITGAGDNAMDKSFPVTMAPVLDAEPLSASLALPEGASLTSDYQWRQDGEGAVTGVSCTVLLDGYDYDYGAAYASQPLPAPDGTLPADTWQVNGLTLLVYDDGAVGWYDTSAGIQWYCAAWDGGEPLVTAFTLMDAQYYTVPTAPEGADVLGYDLFDLDGATVTEVAFTLDGVTWHYRMAPTLDVSETIPDISGFTGGSLMAEGKLCWCPTVLRWDAGGAGCIIWRDLAPGLAYSLTADTSASEDALSDMAALVFKPAQEES